MVKVEDFERNLSPRFSYQNLKYIIQEYKRRYKEIDSIFRKEDLIFDIFNRDKEIDENKFNLEKVLENKKNLDIEIANNFQNILFNTDISHLRSYEQSVINGIKEKTLKLKGDFTKIKKYFEYEVSGSILYPRYVSNGQEYYKHNMLLDLDRIKVEKYEHQLILNPSVEYIYLVINKLITKFENKQIDNYVISKPIFVQLKDKIHLYAKDEKTLNDYLLVLESFIEEEKELVNKFESLPLTLPTYNKYIGYQKGKNYLSYNANYLANIIDKELISRNIKISNIDNYKDEIIDNILEIENLKQKEK
jgi:hypothetical protein